MSEQAKQFTTSHPCHVCNAESVAVTDDGWVCLAHQIDYVRTAIATLPEGIQKSGARRHLSSLLAQENETP